MIMFILLMLLITLVCSQISFYFLDRAVAFRLDYDLRIEARSYTDRIRQWAILHNGFVYSKSVGDFVYEPLPSSRTEEFITDTRFSNLGKAYWQYRKIVRQWKTTSQQKKK